MYTLRLHGIAGCVDIRVRLQLQHGLLHCPQAALAQNHACRWRGCGLHERRRMWHCLCRRHARRGPRPLGVLHRCCCCCCCCCCYSPSCLRRALLRLLCSSRRQQSACAVSRAALALALLPPSNNRIYLQVRHPLDEGRLPSSAVTRPWLFLKGGTCGLLVRPLDAPPPAALLLLLLPLPLLLCVYACSSSLCI